MFRIAFFVDDKKLPAALLALVGIAHGSPEVQPVINVKKAANGKLQAESGGSTSERFAAWLKARGMQEIDATDFKAFLAEAGVSARSITYLAKVAVRDGVIKPTSRRSGGSGTPRIYKVIV